MALTSNTTNILKGLLLCTMLSICSYVSAEGTPKDDPKFIYLHGGKIVEGYNLVVSDPENWYLPITDRKGKSASGKLSIEPSNFKGIGDAIKFVWAPRKDIQASLLLAGWTAIDLSGYENTAMLVLDMKINNMPDKDVTLSMSCGDNCKGEMHIRQLLTHLEKDTWLSLPIALNCFSKKGADLKKINGPFNLSTNGKLAIEITNVRLEKRVAGDQGCE